MYRDRSNTHGERDPEGERQTHRADHDDGHDDSQRRLVCGSACYVLYSRAQHRVSRPKRATDLCSCVEVHRVETARKDRQSKNTHVDDLSAPKPTAKTSTRVIGAGAVLIQTIVFCVATFGWVIYYFLCKCIVVFPTF